ncbi:hypothetical protein BU15DRAFT_81311 [Melanogaster broomeanus]|nr:hypothetical protein BU15DRAFT_81311 [Melanogaster broomeanus]
MAPKASVIDVIQDVDLAGSGVPSLVMRDLSDYCTLPFLAGFHTHAVQASAPVSPTTPVPGSTRKQITYVAVSKKTMPSLVELYLRFKIVLRSMKTGRLKLFTLYVLHFSATEKNAPSKFGRDLPLWKTATTCFLRIVTACVTAMSGLGEASLPAVSDNRIEAIWRQIIEGFRGGILADCSATGNLSLEEREVEENFDLALISSLSARD